MKARVYPVENPATADEKFEAVVQTDNLLPEHYGRGGTKPVAIMRAAAAWAEFEEVAS